MATRLYPQGVGGYVVPPLHDLPVALPDALVVPGLALTQAGNRDSSPTSASGPNGANPHDLWLWAFASPALAAQTIDGTLKGQMRLRETSTSNNHMPNLAVYRLDADWGYQSTLLAPHTDPFTLELSTTLTNRSIPPAGAAALTSTTFTAGDRLLLVLGVRSFSTGSGPAQAALSSAAGTDLPEDTTTTTDLAPWFEFSADLVFAATDPHPALATKGDPLGADTTKVVTASAYGGSGGTTPPPTPTTGQLWPRGDYR